MGIAEDALVFTDPKAYADEPRFHAACRRLRAEAPVVRVDAPDFDPFYAVTRHEDVMEVECHPERWINAPRPALGPKRGDAVDPADVPVRTLVQMDGADHLMYRHVSADWFKPRNIARLGDRAAELSRQAVDHMASLGGRCDFFTEVAMSYPLSMILSLLGLPEEDFGRMLKLTQELFGNHDPEMAREGSENVFLETMMDFFTYFQGIVDDRQARPVDDLASKIANAEVDGAPIGLMETIGYYVIIATAGHDTTSAAISGGMHALLQHPDQLARLQADPTLVGTAVDEMIRWVSPVKQFMRTATEGTVLRGVPIAEGEAVLLSFPSANRDEAVFTDPDRFDVGRTPNRHLGFGFGAHYCLGTHLAKLEMKALYNELIPRLRHIELDGDAEYTRTLFVGGPKHVPVRYEMV